MLKQLSLFAGIEGFGLAGRWLGWDLVASVELEKHCQSAIKKNFPETQIHSDVTTTDFTIYRNTIDIITGGFPCQTFSLSGLGAMDLTLWKEMFRAVLEVQPTWVVAENVYGLVARKKGVALETVCADLESEGFTVFPPVIIPAAGVGAPHRRNRVWIIAYSNQQRGQLQTTGQFEAKQGFGGTCSEGTTSNGDSIGCERGAFAGSIGGKGQEPDQQPCGLLCDQWQEFPTQSAVCRGNDGLPSRVEQIKQYGNAIVPQVFYEIGLTINELHETFSAIPCNSNFSQQA